MAQLGNTPEQLTFVQLEARKSFSLGLWFKTLDESVRNVVDLTGATVTFTMAQLARFGGAVVITQDCDIPLPLVGNARLDLQAEDLDLDVREYNFTIKLLSAEGYSVVVVKGTIELLANTDLDSTNTYDGTNPPESLTVEFSEQNNVTVRLNTLAALELAIGSVDVVDEADAGASIEGSYPYQLLNLKLPRGAAGQNGQDGEDGVGEPPALFIGDVTATGPGEDPEASFSGTGTDVDPYLLNLALPPVSDEQLESILPDLVPPVISDIEADRARALRTFWTALNTVGTTPVDVFVGPSDSIGAGAYAGTFAKKFISVLRRKLRAAVQPSGVKGGAGYFPLGTSPLLQGDGYLVGVAGSTSTNTTDGLGRHALNMGAGSQLTLFFTGTAIDILYKQAAAQGTFTYTIDGGAPSAPVVVTGADDHVKHTVSGLSSASHTIIITVATANVTIEGLFPYDGDETKGLRMWSGAHSGFGASDFVASQTWVESLDNITNCKLVVLPVGSNDWYLGRTPVQAMADILTNIGLVRGKLGASVSIVLVRYYDRPDGANTLPWGEWADQVYKPIADADDNITLFDLDPLFGPLLSDTDDRGGLTTALPGDYVHPTPAGHELIGEKLARFLLPEGIGSAIANGTLDIDKPVSTAQAAADLVAAAGLPYTAIGNFAGGAMAFQALPVSNYSLTAQGNLTLAPSGMPVVAAGRTCKWHLRITQDATGGRTLTLDPAILGNGITPVLQTAAGAVDILEFFYDGVSWWVKNLRADPDLATIAGLTPTTDNVLQSVAGAWASRTPAQLKATLALAKADVGLSVVDNVSDAGKPVSTLQAAAIQLAQDSGDQGVVVATILNFSGAMNFAAFTPILGKIFNINLIGNATFNITGIPAPPANRGGSFLIRFNQDATGSRTLTLTGFKRAGGALVLTTTASASDLIRFVWDGTSWWAVPVVMNGS